MKLSALRSGLSAAVLVALFGACATPKSNADSTALAVDTVKPAPAAVQSSETTTTTKTTTTTTKTKTKAGTSAKTSAKQKADAHLGRDSVIKFDPNDPRRQLPTIPPKKPPQ